MKIPLIENVLKLNDEMALENRIRLREAGVFVVDLIGAPGCGKTALLEATLERTESRIGVLAGDLATTRDAERLRMHGDQVVQINTGKGCHLDANQVRRALDELDLDALDILIIENVGNLICPVGYDLGQDVKVGMFSVAQGDDKAAKHPHLVHASSLILLNMMDLLPHMPFDRSVFLDDIDRLNPKAQIIELSVIRDEIDDWIHWLLDQAEKARLH